MKFSVTFLVVLVTLGFLLPGTHASEHKHERVLILHSYSKADWNDNIMDGIDSVLGGRKNLKMYIEYMDTKEFNSPEYYKMLQNTLQMKYKNIKFDLVITSDDNAWNFAMKHDGELFNGAPIVFCGVNRFKPELIKGKKVTGVVEKGDFTPTLNYMVRAMPKLKHIYIVCDNSRTGKINMANLAKVMDEHFSKLTRSFMKDMTFEEMDQTLQNATPGEDAAFFIAFWKDGSGKAITPTELEQVFRTCKIPVFGRSEWMINRGMTGGKCVSGFNQGEAAAQLAKKILDSPERKIPPVRLDSPNQFMFDYKELQKHRLLNAQLPNDSLVVNKPYSLEDMYQDYKIFFWIVCGLFGLLVVALVILMIDKIKRKQAEKALKQGEKNLNITLESIGDAVIATDAEGTVVRINSVAAELTGWKAKEAMGKRLEKVFQIINSNTGEKAEDPVSKVLKKGKIVSLANDTVLIAKDKTKRQIADSGAPIRNDEGEIVGVVLVFRDVTEEYKLQEQLRQSQKMEAIGQLAGGVAHDFNNLLTAIMGNSQLLAMSANHDSEDAELVEDILKASKRASDLTSQLLAFSRKGPLQNIKVSVHEIIDEIVGILTHSIDKRITIIKKFKATPDTVVGDPSQLQNALLNLGVNARDAMPDGGDLTFYTKNVKITKKDWRVVSKDISEGEYIEVSVKDTGCGMDTGLIQRIFEPFFSTKTPGSGTGLGLASVYGCVVSHGGDIKVKSNPGRGSAFNILLPTSKSQAEKLPIGTGKRITGKGNILVIDDEDFVRALCSKSLSGLGYTVTTFADGRNALDYYRKHADNVDLVILDLIMPNISGEDTFILLKEVDPKVKVLILSGFSKDKTVHQLMKNGALAFVPKPFDIASLSQEVAKCLGKSKSLKGLKV